MATEPSHSPPDDSDIDHDGEEESTPLFTSHVVRVLGSSLLSMMVHAIVLVVMGLMALQPPVVDVKREIVATSTDVQQAIEEVKQQPIEINITDTQVADVATVTEVAAFVETAIAAPPEPAQNNIRVDFADVGIKAMPSTDLTAKIGGGGPTSLAGGRTETAKKQAVAARGGNSDSEAAVALALQWFAKHQMPDGGWTLDFKKCPGCDGKCKHSGERVASRNAATALALLPFLAAGQTHKTGKYKAQVLAGLQYLTNPNVNRQLKLTPAGADYTPDGGNFYTQGLCAMALCEAYAVSEDRDLIAPAQASLNYIMAAQDSSGGGWRYAPGQAGDVSVTGWCLMALKSGHMGHLQVDPKTVRLCDMYLNAMQSKAGAAYGYDTAGDRPTTNAVGLLLRMYMGWKREHPPLIAGVEALSKRKPDPKNAYFNYYATQVLHQFEGPLWDEWNRQMRDHLVSTQDKKGHQAGSWMIEAPGHDIEAGGRLYITALNCLTLEVYYRHLPLYKSKSGDDDF
jgi:hypothetical protein